MLLHALHRAFDGEADEGLRGVDTLPLGFGGQLRHSRLALGGTGDFQRDERADDVQREREQHAGAVDEQVAKDRPVKTPDRGTDAQ